MRRRFHIIWVAFLLLIALVDSVAFIYLQEFVEPGSWLSAGIYWAIPSFLLIWLLYLTRFRSFYRRKPRVQKAYFNFFGLFLLLYLPKMIFVALALAETLVNVAIDLVSLYAIHIRVFSHAGLVLAGALFLLLLYGILLGRFHFKREYVFVDHPQLPGIFDGFRIVHISDVHIGSWVGHRRQIQRAVDLIRGAKPDMIVLTGDLFNNYHEEMEEFKDILRELEAPYGKYAVLGNHDYGDYFHWSNRFAYHDNFEKIKAVYRDIGFRLLCNESDIIHRHGASIEIAGVENWGMPPFHQYGDLQRALSDGESTDFTVLLSHDPSHWRQQVLENGKVQLTLSGHTHGMQFGIYTHGLKWSPASLKYPEWGGLYREEDRYLYVNKGLGYIGFPGRVGIRPEITVLTLKNKKGGR